MKLTQRVRKILANYESDNPGTKANLARILMHGKLGGSGRLVILPVDQGFEHGPARSFAANPPAYDPHYHYQLAIDAGLSAYAAPLGMLEAGADTFAGAIPTILKVNSANSHATSKDQAVTGVRTTPAGLKRDGTPGSTHMPAMDIESRVTVLSEGTRGTLAGAWRRWQGVESENPQTVQRMPPETTPMNSRPRGPTRATVAPV